MPKQIDTIVLPVAGVGSRMLPLTSSIEKCMLSVAGRPVIEYAIADCQKAGIKRVIFVCSERGEKQLHDYFGELSPEVTTQLQALGRDDLISQENERRQGYGITFEYIRQEPGQSYGYGTVVPLHLAKDALKDCEYFAYFMGDDIVYHEDGSSELVAALKAWQETTADHLVMGSPVPRSEVSHYGILLPGSDRMLADILEKPAAEHIPGEPLASLGRFIFHKNIWEFVAAEMAISRTSPEEHLLTTHVIKPAIKAGQTCYVHKITGTYLDAGSPAGLQAANVRIAITQT